MGFVHDQALHVLKRQLEAAKVAFEGEQAAIRAGTLDWNGPRPNKDAFWLALDRYHKCLLEGVIPVDLLNNRY